MDVKPQESRGVFKIGPIDAARTVVILLPPSVWKQDANLEGRVFVRIDTIAHLQHSFLLSIKLRIKRDRGWFEIDLAHELTRLLRAVFAIHARVFPFD